MRVSFEGHGEPIPEVAFPAPGEDPDSFSQSFQLVDGVDFVKAPYVDQDYTNFEVWCVGAAGGRGGNWLGTGDPFNRESFWGGAGGGGGVHRVAGLLADLPDNVTVVVGEAGAAGQDAVDTSAVGAPLPVMPMLPERDGSGAIIMPLSLYPNPDWVEPLAGEAGGGSFFGDVAKASGGMGGGAVWLETTDWSDYYYYNIVDDLLPGMGGTGGLGNRDIPGGGGAGGFRQATEEPILSLAQRGGWDGTIGAGGGGGYGGRYRGVLNPGSSPPIFGWFDAGNGADGAFSFGNPSVFGPGELRKFGPFETPGHHYLTIPGSGGGAKANKLLKYGSRAPGFNPNGLVFIRLYKIV